MTVVVPNALALATIADGSAIVASDHRNNYAATQVGVNGLIAMFTNAPTKGDLIVSAGAGSFDRLGVGANGSVPIADSTQALGIRWGAVAATKYTKTTSKLVSNTVTETDLLNGEITIGAGAMGATSMLRLTVIVDVLSNNAGNFRFRLKLGATTIFDSGASIAPANSATRTFCRISVEIMNLGVTNSQQGRMQVLMPSALPGTAWTTPAQLGISTGAQTLAEVDGPSAVDMTAAQALALTVQHSAASVNQDAKLWAALVEVI